MPYDYNSNPAIPGTMPSNQVQPPQQRNNFGGDFSGQLNDMLAPYQAMASKIQSPYATMSQNSWLAKNHPGVAGILDNAFLTVGSTPGPQGPEGVGGGISRVMQGLMGGQQFRRQQMMQNMMMPYQMLQPQLQAQDTLAQIDARRSQADREQDYHELVTGRNARMLEQSQFEQGKLQIDQQKADQARFGRVLNDPEERMAHVLHPFKDPQNPTLDEQRAIADEYTSLKAKTRAGIGEGGAVTQGALAAAMTPRGQGESESAWATRVGNNWMKLGGGAVGARVGAEQNAPHPYADTKTLLANERQSAYATLEKVPSAKEWEDQNLTDPEYWKNPQKSYEGKVKSVQGTKQQTDVDLAKYERSSAPRSGIGFQEYLQNRAQYDGAAPTQAPPPEAINAPRAVDKAWTYKP